MPGYELNRFVDANMATELRDMNCAICQEIFCKPLVASCCNQIFCESCIKPWLDGHHTCPSDHKPLRSEQLTQPPAVLLKMLNSKRIRCINCGKGCPEVGLIETIDQHEMNCMYGKDLCKTCGGCLGAANAAGQHDCMKELLLYKQTIGGTMERQRKELEEANTLNRNLRSQIDNYTKTIKDLTMERARLAELKQATPTGCGKTENTNSGGGGGGGAGASGGGGGGGVLGSNAIGGANRVNTNKDLLIEARKYVNSPIVDGHKTRKDIVDKVIEVTKEALSVKGDRIYDVTRFIKEVLDANFMGDWNAYIVYNNIGFVFHNIQPDAFVEVKFGKATVTVYKTFDSLGFSRLVSFIKAGVIKEFTISKTGFEDSATKQIEKSTMNCLRTCSDMNEFTDKVTADLMATYGGIWHCFIYKTNFGFYCVRSDKGRFCLMTSSDVKILIFQ